jgi:hypothetical protein
MQLLLFLLAREVHRRTVGAVHAAATKFLPRMQLFSFFKAPSGGSHEVHRRAVGAVHPSQQHARPSFDRACTNTPTGIQFARRVVVAPW